MNSSKVMTMPKRLMIACCLALSAVAGLPARAEEPPVDPAVFQMADGLFYHPATGRSAVSREALLASMPDPAGVLTVTDSPAPPPPEPAAPPALQEAILRARALIAERIVQKRAAQKKIPTASNHDVWVDVTLAVWNAKTGEIALVDVRKNGARLDVSNEDADIDVAVRRSNGVNSEFVLDDGDKAVVAVQYPIFREKWLTKKKRVYELHDVVYTPYSQPLHTAEMIAWGRATFDRWVEQAFADLRGRGVRSRAFPDRLLADAIDPELVKAIAIIEHLSEYALSGENAARAVDSMYVVLAANQQDAYAYSRSSAGARGLVQFIPSTYKLMVKRQDLGLTEDFEAGMSDPVNAIRAQIAYLDAELAGMPLAVKDLAKVDPRRVNEYLAAAYNGGGTRVRRAIAAWGDGWSELHEADIADLKKQHGKADADIVSLKAKIKKESDAKKLKSLKAQLAATQKTHDEIYARQLQVKKGTLRKETSLYVQKLRGVLKLWNPPPAVS